MDSRDFKELVDNVTKGLNEAKKNKSNPALKTQSVNLYDTLMKSVDGFTAALSKIDVAKASPSGITITLMDGEDVMMIFIPDEATMLAYDIPRQVAGKGKKELAIGWHGYDGEKIHLLTAETVRSSDKLFNTKVFNIEMGKFDKSKFKPEQ